MKSVKPCYVERIQSVSNRLCSDGGDFRFAVVADSHLDNSLEDTIANVHAVHTAVKFDCTVHLGDFLNGNLPLKHTRRLLKEQMELFRSAADCPFYPAQGNHDGYLRYNPTRGTDTAEDELWYEATSYLQEDSRVARIGNKPYFYVDFAEKKIRLVVLCSFLTQIDEENRHFVKTAAIDIEQARWFKTEALDLPAGWTTVIFSNTVPKSRFSGESDPFIYRGYSNELMMSLIQKARKRGVQTACWIAGGYNADAEYELGGIPYVSVAGQLATRDTTMKYAEARVATERTLNTKNQDCWDSVILDTESRTVRFIRFGSGEDRTITY